MPQTVFSLLGVLLTVGVVLFLAYWCTKLIAKRGLPGWPQPGSPAGEMRLLWQQNVGKGERLVLLQVHGRCLLLGVTAGGITLLDELEKEEAAQWLQKQPDQPQAPSFAQVLRSNFGKKK